MQSLTSINDVVTLQCNDYVVLEGHLLRRKKRAYRGRYRGQTQSQYLAINHENGKDDGKAEAHSNADSSRASVSKYKVLRRKE